MMDFKNERLEFDTQKPLNFNNNPVFKNQINISPNINFQNNALLVDQTEEFDVDNINIENDISSKKYFSNTGHSDKDNIKANQVSRLMNDVRNAIGDENYNIFKKYCEGKTLGELLDKDGNIVINDSGKILKIIQSNNIGGIAPQEFMKQMNEKIKKGDNTKIIDISKDMLNSKILEINTYDNGYDCMVLENQNGDYMMFNACTNGEDYEDIVSLAYTMTMQLFGNTDMVEFVFTTIIQNPDISSELQKIFNDDKLNNELDFGVFEKYYYTTIINNVDNIKKWAEKAKKSGKKVELYGYSKGGGEQLTSYSVFKSCYPELADSISSVSVYNPAISILEVFSSFGFSKYANLYVNFKISSENKLLDDLSKDEKVLIYSAQEDYVSTFNSLNAMLKDRFVIVPAKKLENNSVSSIIDIGNFIIGSKGNHGFSNIDMDKFTKDGYLSIENEGEFINVADSSGNIMGVEDTYDFKFNSFLDKFKVQDKNSFGGLNRVIDEQNLYFENRLDELRDEANLKIIRNAYYEKIADNFLSYYGFDVKDLNLDESKEDMVNDLIDYFKQHLGDEIVYEDMVDIIVDDMWIIADDIINNSDDIDWYETLAANMFGDEDSFKEAIRETLNDPKNKKEAVNAVGLLISSKDKENGKDAFATHLNFVIDDLEKKYDDEIDDSSWISRVVNSEIKNKTIGALRDSVDEFVKKGK